MKHTKGPWRVEEGTTVIWGACDPDDTSTYGMGYPVADCRTMFGYIPHFREHREDEAESNAQLIAVSPELLDLLVRSNRWLGMVDVSYLSTESENEFWSYMQEIEDAISKAKGEIK